VFQDFDFQIAVERREIVDNCQDFRFSGESGNAQQHLIRGRVDFESFSRRWVLGAGGGLNSNLGASCGFIWRREFLSLVPN